MAKKLLLIVLAVLVVGGAVYLISPAAEKLGGNEERTLMVLDRLHKGQNSGIKEVQNLAITSSTVWMDLWINKIKFEGKTKGAPYVKFDEDMVIAVFQGEKPNGGYSIEITGVYEEKNKIVAEVKEISPGQNCINTEALTSPFEIVKVPKTDKPVEFKISQEVKECEE